MDNHDDTLNLYRAMYSSHLKSYIDSNKKLQRTLKLSRLPVIGHTFEKRASELSEKAMHHFWLLRNLALTVEKDTTYKFDQSTRNFLFLDK